MFDQSDRPGIDDSRNAAGTLISRWPALTALTAGTLAASLTISTQYPWFFKSRFAEFAIPALFPGIFGSIAIGDNVHDPNLWFAAGINWAFYFLVLWTVCGVSRLILRRNKQQIR